MIAGLQWVPGARAPWRSCTIFDSHAHVDESPLLGWSDPPEVIVRLMDEARVSRAVIMSSRDMPGPDEGVIENVVMRCGSIRIASSPAPA